MNVTQRTAVLSLAGLGLGVGCAAPSAPSLGRIDPELLRGLEVEGGSEPLDASAALARGDHVALIFWQPWCKRCAGQLPALGAIHRDPSAGLRAIGVLSGGDDVVDLVDVRAKVRSLELDYPQVRDRRLDLTRALGVAHLPTIVLIAPDGALCFRGSQVPRDGWREFLAGG